MKIFRLTLTLAFGLVTAGTQMSWGQVAANATHRPALSNAKLQSVPGGAGLATTAAVAALSPLPAPAALVDHPGAVKAPVVGTAYLAPQPGDPPFVRLGDAVTEGQPLLIVEAMKVMNQIRSPRAGRIARIFIEDADPVEYDAPLMLIE